MMSAEWSLTRSPHGYTPATAVSQRDVQQPVVFALPTAAGSYMHTLHPQPSAASREQVQHDASAGLQLIYCLWADVAH
jgi:hypothetical protein